jgi:hypothetical protein
MILVFMVFPGVVVPRPWAFIVRGRGRVDGGFPVRNALLNGPRFDRMEKSAMQPKAAVAVGQSRN